MIMMIVKTAFLSESMYSAYNVN